MMPLLHASGFDRLQQWRQHAAHFSHQAHRALSVQRWGVLKMMPLLHASGFVPCKVEAVAGRTTAAPGSIGPAVTFRVAYFHCVNCARVVATFVVSFACRRDEGLQEKIVGSCFAFEKFSRIPAPVMLASALCVLPDAKIRHCYNK